MSACSDEVQRLRGNPNLRRPPVFRACGSGIPNTVPVRGQICGAGNQPVQPSPGLVDLKVVGGPFVSKGVQYDCYRIVAILRAVACQGMVLDCFWIRIVASKTEDEGVMIEQQPHF